MSKEQNTTLLLNKLLCVSRQLKRSLQVMNIDPNLNNSTISVMFQLEHHSMKMNDIADYLCITLGAATSLVDKLERQHLVERVRSVEDRRIIFVQLTSTGKDKIQSLRNHILSEVRSIFNEVSNEDLQSYIHTAQSLEALLSAYNENVCKTT
ncbi:MarR family winged helix-turn-helix transcriptional regulator [Paenibacillus sp. OAS669]|uniref:MarR family winged helix-turn-helix transcriptional regulator n=1 Tax=Paenibacillus sp. OAS669 TaxID=2663821 RepID=UPI001789A67E|nr:MarR family transcriptional regulator [Paenibacillus sp. OAS669]MBE1440720.1 DNA-binding MarR family transcriptional regulator [Paenibacillus sp. OAS669]